MTEPTAERHPVKRLAFFLAAGVLIFDGGLFLVLAVLGSFGVGFDPSVARFYPLLAIFGAVFGFERWWSNEIGPYNPIHDR